MIYEFKLPDIGEGVVEGEVVRWLVAEGDVVREDQPLVEIMTDKATVEIPAPRAGRVGKRMFAEGQICPVGKVLITIEMDDAAAAAPSAKGASRAPEAQAAMALVTVPAVDVAGADKRAASDEPAVLATPATRRLARELAVEIRRVAGSGPAGRITSDDVRRHHAGTPPQAREDARPQPGPVSPSSTPAATTETAAPARTAATAETTERQTGDVRIPFRGIRKKIAERLVHSKQTAAHFTYVEEVDCTALVAARAQANGRLAERQPPAKLSYLPFIIKATVAALRRFPQLNATLDEAAGEIVQRQSHHIGLATATDSGLIVPVIRNAGHKTLLDLGAEIDRLAEATRLGKATREDLSGSTFTITSLGLLGGLLATPIINFPEVAILGVHKIAKRPAAVGNEIALRDMMNLSISVDHRVVDGYDAARFVAEIKGALENPPVLLTDLT